MDINSIDDIEYCNIHGPHNTPICTSCFIYNTMEYNITEEEFKSILYYPIESNILPDVIVIDTPTINDYSVKSNQTKDLDVIEIDTPTTNDCSKESNQKVDLDVIEIDVQTTNDCYKESNQKEDLDVIEITSQTTNDCSVKSNLTEDLDVIEIDEDKVDLLYNKYIQHYPIDDHSAIKNSVRYCLLSKPNMKKSEVRFTNNTQKTYTIRFVLSKIIKENNNEITVDHCSKCNRHLGDYICINKTCRMIRRNLCVACKGLKACYCNNSSFINIGKIPDIGKDNRSAFRASNYIFDIIIKLNEMYLTYVN